MQQKYTESQYASCSCSCCSLLPKRWSSEWFRDRKDKEREGGWQSPDLGLIAWHNSSVVRASTTRKTLSFLFYIVWTLRESSARRGSWSLVHHGSSEPRWTHFCGDIVGDKLESGEAEIENAPSSFMSGSSFGFQLKEKVTARHLTR